ncbi:hypothetical protein OCS_00961 [Ophiocordyceps sinensis CO18]|uniref:Uncharacterized protein n=1 Tax=Ophiocordyceps sinensis (strain Co18 / CGMCC 3.14243) TaxID=911162 RepID=T5AD05_OPHSC|nr:hypothetical protein OCS_00961 [Ophiocordyceps sinensis CO18]
MSDSDTPLSIERPLSLRQILRLNSRERLLVPPLRWTDRHLELLRCSFDEPCPAAPCTQADTREYSGRVFNNLVLSQWKMGAREGHVPGILTEADCPLKRGSVPLPDLIRLVSDEELSSPQAPSQLLVQLEMRRGAPMLFVPCPS